MDPSVVREVNKLWDGIYPYLAHYIADLYGDEAGDVLELGPFSGGIAKGLLSLSPNWKIVIAGEQMEVFDPVKEEINASPDAEKITFKHSPLSRLVFLDRSFDLVISRGAFFFLSPGILREVYRVLRPGGLAVLGGGYGPHTPQAPITEIAEESKRLNQLLGKTWITREDLTRMTQEAALEGEVEISEEGGLWLILRRGGKRLHGEGNIGLGDALCLSPREIISLVGAGGKTTLMFSLAKELKDKGLKVITTTTTKIFEPTIDQTPCLVIQEDPVRTMDLLRDGLNHHGHVTVAARRFPQGKIGGITPDFIERMADELPVDYLIVEADGAKKLPIKAPANHEPVVPPATSLLVPMVGIDALGRPLGPEEAFRPGRIAQLTGSKIGDTITPGIVAALLVHPQGLMKGAPTGARIIFFVNKVETTEGLNGGRLVAREVASISDQRIERIVLSRLFYHHPIVEVIRRETSNERDL